MTISGDAVYSSGKLPVIIYKDSFPVDMVTSGHADACADDGRDIRFTEDAGGSIPVPSIVIKCLLNADSSLSKVAVMVSVDMVKGTPKDIYCNWGNSSADIASATSPYGAQACLPMMYGVNFLQENPANDEGFKFGKDATGQYAAFSVAGSPAPVQVDGPNANVGGLEITDTSGIIMSENRKVQATPFGVIFIVKPIKNTGKFFGRYTGSGKGGGFSYSEWCVHEKYGAPWNARQDMYPNAWQLIYLSRPGAGACKYRAIAFDGAGKVKTKSPHSSNVTSMTFDKMGAHGGGSFNGPMTMFMTVRTQELTQELATQVAYSMLYKTAGVATAGAIEASTSSATLKVVGIKDNTEVRIYQGETELAGIENSVGDFSWGYSVSGKVDIVLLHMDYEYIRLKGITLTGKDMTIPVQQRLDRNYKNV